MNFIAALKMWDMLSKSYRLFTFILIWVLVQHTSLSTLLFISHIEVKSKCQKIKLVESFRYYMLLIKKRKKKDKNEVIMQISLHPNKFKEASPITKNCWNNLITKKILTSIQNYAVACLRTIWNLVCLSVCLL